MKKGNTARSADRWVVVLIVGIVALFLIAVSYAFYNNKKYTNKDPNNEIVVREDSEQILNAYQKDSDGDGLADWEELLWDMDPNNPDTDGDGVGDASDVLRERTALVDPQESVTESDTSTAENNSDSDIKNATEAMAHELFGSYMYSLREGGVTLSEEKEQEIITGALESVSPVIKPPRYTRDNVTVVAPTQENRIAYIEVVFSSLRKMIDGVTSEHEAIYAIGQGEIEWAKTELNKTIEQYNYHLNTLKNARVPSDAVEIHTTMVQALLNYIYVLDGFAVVDEDPLRAAASAKVFVGVERALNESYKAMREYIELYYPLAQLTKEDVQ